MALNDARNGPIEKVIEWLALNVGLALLPLLTAWLMRRLSAAASQPGAYTPEVLFFAISISATSVANIGKIRDVPNVGLWHSLFKYGLLICALFSAILYGANLFDGVINATSNAQAFRANLAGLSGWLAVILFAIGLLVEVFIVITLSPQASEKKE